MKIIEPKTSKGPVDWFTGDVYPTIVLSGEQPSRVRMGSVHWHGASLDSFMVHLAIWEAPDNGEPETSWGEHLTDEEYSLDQ